MLSYVDGPSLYVDGRNNPSLYVDPTGLEADDDDLEMDECEAILDVDGENGATYCLFRAVVSESLENGWCLPKQHTIWKFGGDGEHYWYLWSEKTIDPCKFNAMIGYTIGITDSSVEGGCRDENDNEEDESIRIWHIDGDRNKGVKYEISEGGGHAQFWHQRWFIGGGDNNPSSEGYVKFAHEKHCGTARDEKEITFISNIPGLTLTMTITTQCIECELLR